MKTRIVNLTACLGLVLLGMTGCSTPQTRSQEKGQAFTSLPKKQQETAMKGGLTEGMNDDAVYVALGNPDKILQGEEKGRKVERWVYSETITREIPAWHQIHEQTANGKTVVHQRYEPIILTSVKDVLEVTFKKGKVGGWRKL